MVTIRTSGGEESIPLKRSAAAGVAAFAAGYVLTFVLLAVDGTSESSTSGEESGFVEGLQVIGLFFYNTMFVDVHVGGLMTVNILQETETSVPTVVYYLAPVVAIAGAALLLVRATPFRPASAEASAKLGASVIAGYLPMAVLGLVAFELEVDGLTLSPDSSSALLLVGAVYPLLCGAIGGLLFWHRHSESGAAA